MEPALYLLPVTLGDTPLENVLPQYNNSVIAGIRHFIVEDVRSARRFLRKVDPQFDIDGSQFFELNKHTSPQDVAGYLRPLQDGKPMGVISEAGCPAVADPGADIVALAHRKGIRVVPLVGPSSILMVMMASGQNGQSFAFVGYLPVKEPDRSRTIKSLERRAQTEHQAQIFIEAPYRNVKLFESLVATLSPKMRLTVAADITSPEELIQTLTVEEWRKRGVPEIQKRPTIFVLGI